MAGKTLAEKILSVKSGSDVRADRLSLPGRLSFRPGYYRSADVATICGRRFTQPAKSVRMAIFLDHAAPSPSYQLSTTMSSSATSLSRLARCYLMLVRGSATSGLPNLWLSRVIWW